MKDVIIKERTEAESHPQDEVFYRAMNTALTAEAFRLRGEGQLTDHEIIAISVRAAQQLAANATGLAQEMEIELELAK